MKNILVVFATLSIVGIILASAFIQGPVTITTDQTKLKKFSSYSELENFVKSNTESYAGYGYGYLGGTFASRATSGLTTGVQESVEAPAAYGETSGQKSSEDYSVTNIQVAGVDESDFVKNDGKYIYAISGTKVVIVDAYPAEAAKIVSEIELNETGTPNEIFVNGDKLVVFGQVYENYYVKGVDVGTGVVTERNVESSSIGIALPGYPSYYTPKTFIEVFDISDRQNPVLKRNVTVDGNYFDSRMIGDYVYAIVNEPVYYSYSEPGPIPMPVTYSGGIAKATPASEIYYFDFPDSSYIFTNIIAINTQNDAEEPASKTFLMGYSEKMYVSAGNIYITYTKRLSYPDMYEKIIDEAILPSVSLETQSKINEIKNSNADKYEKLQEIGKVLQEYLESLGPEQAADVMKLVQDKTEAVYIEIAKELEKTVVHKISVSGNQIEYKTKGEVPGYVLNQFSMDEHDSYFRVATTTNSWDWRGNPVNNVYVLDENMKIVGRLEDLAKGERIYSVRFIGDRAYMVTFRQVDPLFVIDLSNPTNPQVLGYLKIKGVSDYLHPYDETHLIGVGRDANEEGRITGMKLSLFDVSDVSNPKEVSKYVIGGDGAYVYSEALYDHKAFLFSKSKNLLVLPIQISGGVMLESGKWESWQGAYVFNLDLENGFVLKGKITHVNETAESEYYYDYQSQVRRSLYMDNVLYTISSRMIKMNDLGNIGNEINKIELPQQGIYYPYPLRGI